MAREFRNAPLVCELMRFAVCLVVCFVAATAHAASSQSVLLVVNSKSPESLALANHYIALRKIPPSHVVYLDRVIASSADGGETISSTRYRTDIRAPVMRHIKEHGLRDQIGCIVYSAGLPTRVIVGPEQKKYLAYRFKEYDIHYHAPYASLTSVTFFQSKFFSKRPIFLDSHSNWYAQRSLSKTRPFPPGAKWSSRGQVVPAGDNTRSYMLSTMLAVVRPKGSTLDQSLSQLTRSVESDGSQPEGIFYFAKHADPRSETRHDQFASAAMMLRKMEHKVEVSAEKLPKDERILGATLGSPSLDWPKCGSEFVPGAFCDNFTSYGAWWQKGQTKLTHYLNHGAAGATGTIYEPYTIAEKIPTAAAHLHYARGCTLAESIYQTVRSPYQLLVVGDPLCRPFAKLPEFTVEGIRDRSAVHVDLEITLAAKPSKHKIQRYDIFIDGVLDQTVLPDQPVKIPIAKLSGGYHEIQITAMDDSVAQASQTKTFAVFVVPRPIPEEQKLKLKVDDLAVGLHDKINVSCNFPEMWKVRLFQNSRVVGEFVETNQPISIDARLLGAGKTRLFPAAIVKEKKVRGVPVEVTIAAE